jgi:F-type H+-transporting ATPase subunit a
MITLSPDQIVYWQMGFVTINATLVFTWLVMALLVLLAWLIKRKIVIGPPIPGWQNLVETLIAYIRSQVRDITQQDPDRILPFSGTLFLFISVSNLLDVVPGYHPPTSSLYTTGALALTVFFAVPAFGIAEHGFRGYLRHYTQPTVLMLPFNVISEISRTLAMAVRLFGNVLSETLIVAVLLSIVPFFVPVVMQVLGLIIGQVQAFIFAVLATVYIGAATRKE